MSFRIILIMAWICCWWMSFYADISDNSGWTMDCRYSCSSEGPSRCQRLVWKTCRQVESAVSSPASALSASSGTVNSIPSPSCLLPRPFAVAVLMLASTDVSEPK